MKPARRRRMRTLRRAAVSLLVAGVVFELVLRALLFGQAAPLERLGEPLRQAWMYADWRSEDCYRLEALFEGGREHPHHDPLLGWLKPGVLAGPYRHAREDELVGRRPVLLYGDSFAACVTEPGTCFEDLLAAAPEGEGLHMLNLGVGGYGLGQTYLLLRETIARYAGRDPIVMVGVLVDDDLDRSLHGLREFTKPRFDCDLGGVRVHAVEHRGTRKYAEEHPPEIASYAWRFLLHGAGIVPQRARRVLSLEALQDNAKMELNRCLIEAVQAELEGRGLEYFFVLFHGDRAIHEPGPYTWRERFLHETLLELGVPFVSTKRAFLEDHARTGRWAEDWFIPEGLGRNHYVPEANAIAFQAMLRGLRGRFETRTYLRRAPEHPKVTRGR